MDPEFVATIARVAGGEKINVARFCREHAISRGVFYKYVARFRAEGTDGFTRRSSAPHHRPSALPASVAEVVLRARKELADEGRDAGPISIGWRLEDQQFTPLPSRASIYRVLRDRGQIIPEPAKRPKSRRRFTYADPNGCWQIDGLEYYLAGGEKVCIIQILDDHSRLDVCSYAATSESTAATLAALEQAFAGYGLPVRVLSDNGLAFSGKHRDHMAATERALAERGIQAIASTPRHPQTCGKDERGHATLRRWLAAHPTAATLDELQILLEGYRHMYNNRRHQGIDGQTPQQRFDASPKTAPATTTQPPAGSSTRPVSTTGVVPLHGYSIILGRRWANTTATLYWQGNRVTVMINDTVARQLTLNTAVRYQRLTNNKLSTTS